MKFLIISRAKDTFSTLPPAMLRQLMEATIAYMDQGKKEGKVLEYYFIPGWDRSIVISESDSAEAIVQAITGLPIGAFLDFEVYPLADPNESMKTYIEALKTAEKMMPGPPG
jgi:muconolactone delta-isomerase